MVRVICFHVYDSMYVVRARLVACKSEMTQTEMINDIAKFKIPIYRFKNSFLYDGSQFSVPVPEYKIITFTTIFLPLK